MDGERYAESWVVVGVAETETRAFGPFARKDDAEKAKLRLDYEMASFADFSVCPLFEI